MSNSLYKIGKNASGTARRFSYNKLCNLHS